MNSSRCPIEASSRPSSPTRRALTALAAVSALGALLLGCGSSSDDADNSSGSSGSRPTVSSAGLTPGAQDALEERHDALCNKTVDTSSYEEWTLANQRSDCERKNDCCGGEDEDCDDAAFGVPYISYIRDAMECGLNTFDRAAADRCIQNRTATACSVEPERCDEEIFVIGTLKRGDPCKDGAYECAPGLYCESGNVILGIGVCEPGKALGEACVGANECGAYYCSLTKDVCIAFTDELICSLR